ncbi:hypothetical protein IFM47457_06306 [Aspergillus lentulus]|nr:hypothetical protein IFM47457_06306 [Aspergillus lentulus]
MASFLRQPTRQLDSMQDLPNSVLSNTSDISNSPSFVNHQREHFVCDFEASNRQPCRPVREFLRVWPPLLHCLAPPKVRNDDQTGTPDKAGTRLENQSLEVGKAEVQGNCIQSEWSPHMSLVDIMVRTGPSMVHDC